MRGFSTRATSLRGSSTIIFKVICNYRNEQERSLRSVGEGDSGARG